MKTLMMIWMMGVGISANASCVDFGGNYHLWSKFDPQSSAPVEVRLEQKGCESIEYKGILDGTNSVVELTASKKEDVQVSDSELHKFKLSSQFTGQRLVFGFETLFKREGFSYEETMIFEKVSSKLLKLDLFSYDGRSKRAVTTLYYVKD